MVNANDRLTAGTFALQIGEISETVFFNQEWQRQKDPVGESRVTLPTALERKGDFSQSVDNNGNLYPYIRDYTLLIPNAVH